MYCIKTDKANCDGCTIIGQIDNDSYVIEIEQLPEYEHEDITDAAVRFEQRIFPKEFGIKLSYAELAPIKAMFDELGDEAIGVRDMTELQYREQQRDYITSLELALVDFYEGSL